MSMTFEAGSSVMLLFHFWDVQGPAGMVLSVFMVLLLTVFYELLKVWRIWLGKRPSPFHSSDCQGSSTALASSLSESSLAPMEQTAPTRSPTNRWLLRGIQTALHILQVTLGYMLMLCVMSYNTWIFLGVILGSVLGYFIGFPLLGQI
ncbi:probable low affinity copper uptake protein 2 isoform X2 [Salvelinus fontinalis]|uniref:probable low affinity copper uptake protein 2 isoform X2 n=1 Tax=Salvelinus fontinalis TaxID=8038 RepID=UPI002485C7B7|nr:probable low affinity copper uptake protein 2 isoform X2 [Salvelinus fontinalis]